MRVLIQAQTNSKHKYGYDLELAYRENDVLPWSDEGVLIGRKKDDIVFIIVKVDGKNKVMYKCNVLEDNVDKSNTIDDSKYYYSKLKQEENAKNRMGTCLLLKRLQYIDDNRLYMKKLKDQGLTKRDYEQNHTTDKESEKSALFNYLDKVFNEYIDSEDRKDIENDFNNIESESNNVEEKYRKEFVKTRIGQGKFRDALIKKHGCKCDICFLNMKELLIASHIKEYSKCKNNEHLDFKNGLLLCANHDKLFDKHLISFNSDGKIIISESIDLNNYNKININKNIVVNKNLFEEEYMSYHRERLSKENLSLWTFKL